MSTILEELENRALQLPPHERSKLVHLLIESLEGKPGESPEAIAKAWDEEIARRVADMEAGRTEWVPADAVMTSLRDKLNAAQTTRTKS